MQRIGFGRLILYCVHALALITPIRIFIAQPFLVSGSSMTPTFEPGDYLIVDELTYRLRSPERGDVIIFGYPLDPAQILIKRIIALPGETVQISNGVVTVVGSDQRTIQVLDEPYRMNGPQRKEVSRTTLHDDEYFVLGDDRDVSADSRVWGPLQRRFIIGRALIRVLPLTRAALLPGAYHFDREL
jgi:signal peptidase I